MRRTPIAHVIFPRPNLERPVPEFIWDAVELEAEERALDLEVLLPVPAASLRRLQGFARERKGAAAWPAGMDARLLALTPRPTLIPFVPVPGRSIESAAVAVATELVTRRRARRPAVLIGAFLDEGGYVAALAARSLDIPSLVTAHGTDTRALEATGGALAAKGRRSRLALEQATRVVAVSAELARRVEDVGRAADVIPFSARPERFPSAPLPARGGPARILFVGRVGPKKGVGTLLRAFAQVLERRPAVLRLVGAPEPGFSAEALVAELGLPAGSVELRGELPRDAVLAEYQQADVVTLPSEAEGLPSVLVEALLVGRPVVASAVGGIPELVDDRVGRLVASGSAQALAEALEAVLAEQARGAFPIEALRARALPFSWAGAGPRLGAIVRSLAGVE